MSNKTLAGKSALVLGVANERSIAWAVAQSLHEQGCEVAFNFLGESLERRVRPLAESVQSKLVEPCDVQDQSQIDSIFKKIDSTYGKLDFLIHSLAFAQKEDLDGRFVDTSREGFLKAMEISAFSFVACAKAAEPLMEKAGGGRMITMSYYGAEKVVPNYNMMGVAKAALESSVRYLAHDLGPKKITVNAISAGPIKTLAASGVKDLRSMLSHTEQRSPMKENISTTDVGQLSAFLCGPGGAHITGSTLYVDSGLHILGM